MTPEELQKRIDQAQEGEKLPPAAEPSSPQDRRQAGAGITLAVSIMVCAGLGVGVDHYFDSKPIALIIFLLLGIATGFYSVYKASKG